MTVRIETRFTRLIGCAVPVMQAPMSWASSLASLPAAVSLAGGLGVIAAGPMRLDDVAAAIRDVRLATDRPFAVNVPLNRKGTAEVLDLLEAERIPVFVGSQGGPERYVERFKRIGTVCLHVVGSVEHARKAAARGVDALVVAGAEAGGHPAPDLVSTLVLGRAVVRSVPELPAILGGGLVDGHGLAAALALGADAAEFGTRFLMTPESGVHERYRQSILDAKASDTLLVGRDFGIVRVLRNAFSRRLEAAEMAGASIDARRELFQSTSLKRAAFDGDVEEGKVEAGQSAGLIDAVVPAGLLVRRIVDEYLAAVARMPGARDEETAAPRLLGEVS